MKKLISIISFLFIGFACVAEPVKSMLGSDGTDFNSDELMPTAADYVQDGLVLMLDAIENAGWGQHDPNAIVWKDLVGNKDFTLASDAFFNNTSLFSPTSPYASYSGTIFSSDWDGVQIETAFQFAFNDTSTFPNIFGSQSDRYGFFFHRQYSIWTIKWYGDQYSRVSSSSNSKWFSCGGLSFGFSNASIEGTLTIDGIYSWTGGNYVLANATETWVIGGNSNQIRYLNGKVHCIRVYSRQLSPQEIQYNYLVDKERFGL